jgi:putative copper resistance protein D
LLEFAIAALRFAQFLSAAVLFGAPALLLYAVGANNADWRWPKPLLIACGLILAAATIGGFFAQTINMSGSLDNALSPDTLGYVLFSTDFGRSAGVRAVLAVIGVVVIVIVGLAVAGPGRLVCAIGAVTLASLAWSGHGAGDGAIHLFADLIHLLAAGAWIGALAALTSMLTTASSAERLESLHAALRRFSGAGTAAVLLILATGLVNSLFLVGLDRWRMLFTTLYGGLLLAKVALFIAMLALAAGNRFRLTPRLGLTLDADGSADLGMLRASVIAETALAVLVLAIVGVLGVLTPIIAQ